MHPEGEQIDQDQPQQKEGMAGESAGGKRYWMKPGDRCQASSAPARVPRTKSRIVVVGEADRPEERIAQDADDRPRIVRDRVAEVNRATLLR